MSHRLRAFVAHAEPGWTVSVINSAVKRGSRRSSFVAFLLGATLLSACWLNSEDVKFSIDNRTDSVLCAYPTHEDASAGRCKNEVEPKSSKPWLLGCGDGPGADTIPVTVVLTAKEGEHRIYERTAECRVWQASGRTFVIERRGDEFVITDPLEDT